MTTSDRTWPIPDRPPAMRMRWHDLLFAHWPVPSDALQRLLPPTIRLDTFDGQAWIAVVPFRMTDVAPRGCPALPWLSAFPELNVRTYVTIQGKPGVWFFSLDATNPVAVRMARWLFHLKYTDARISITHNDDGFEYHSQRVHRREPKANLDMMYRPVGQPFQAPAGTLEYWLTSRYCLYTQDRRGNLLRGEIDHSPWSLQTAEAVFKENSMLQWLGLPTPQTEPHLLFSRDIRVAAWNNERVR